MYSEDTLAQLPRRHAAADLQNEHHRCDTCKPNRYIRSVCSGLDGRSAGRGSRHKRDDRAGGIGWVRPERHNACGSRHGGIGVARRASDVGRGGGN